jgi:hypothetical protein
MRPHNDFATVQNTWNPRGNPSSCNIASVMVDQGRPYIELVRNTVISLHKMLAILGIKQRRERLACAAVISSR